MLDDADRRRALPIPREVSPARRCHSDCCRDDDGGKELNLASPLRDIEIEEDKEYWQALGVFIEDFASIESLVFTYLFVCSRTPPLMA